MGGGGGAVARAVKKRQNMKKKSERSNDEKRRTIGLSKVAELSHTIWIGNKTVVFWVNVKSLPCLHNNQAHPDGWGGPKATEGNEIRLGIKP